MEKKRKKNDCLKLDIEELELLTFFGRERNGDSCQGEVLGGLCFFLDVTWWRILVSCWTVILGLGWRGLWYRS